MVIRSELAELFEQQAVARDALHGHDEVSLEREPSAARVGFTVLQPAPKSCVLFALSNFFEPLRRTIKVVRVLAVPAQPDRCENLK